MNTPLVAETPCRAPTNALIVSRSMVLRSIESRVAQTLHSGHVTASDRVCLSLYQPTGPQLPAGRAQVPWRPDDLVHVDHGLTGRNRERPGLNQTLAACRVGDTRAVSELDGLARSLPGARDIVEDLTKRDIEVSSDPSTTPPIRSAACCSTSWPR